MSGEPTFDSDGYPTDETLQQITDWPITSNDDFASVMDFAGRAWHWPDFWTCEPGFVDEMNFRRRRYVFSTGGWSGNESIVAAVEANGIVQMVGAWSWRLGGHYEYRFPATPLPAEPVDAEAAGPMGTDE